MKINDLLFLTPYVPDVSRILIEEVHSHGINTSVTGTFNEESEQNVARIKPSSIIQAVSELYSGQPAIFISCTNLQTLSIIEEIAFLFLLIIFSPIIIICVRQLIYDFDYLLGKENDTETFGERIYNLTQKYK